MIRRKKAEKIGAMKKKKTSVVERFITNDKDFGTRAIDKEPRDGRREFLLYKIVPALVKKK